MTQTVTSPQVRRVPVPRTRPLDAETVAEVREEIDRARLLLDEVEHTPADRIVDVREWYRAQELLLEEIRDLERWLEGEAA